MRVFRVLSVVMIALVIPSGLAACGKDKKEEASAPSAEEWANGVCSDLNAWASELSNIASKFVGGRITADGSLQRALDDAKTATQKLGDEFDNAGSPDIDGGEEAKKAADEFEQEASKTLDEIDAKAKELESADDVSGFLSGLADLAQSVQGLITSARDLSSTLEGLGVEDQLKTAIAAAPACQKLTSGN